MHYIYVYIYFLLFFPRCSLRLIAHGHSSDGRANLPVCSTQQQLGIQVLVIPCLGVKTPIRLSALSVPSKMCKLKNTHIKLPVYTKIIMKKKKVKNEIKESESSGLAQL